MKREDLKSKFERLNDSFLNEQNKKNIQFEKKGNQIDYSNFIKIKINEYYRNIYKKESISIEDYIRKRSNNINSLRNIKESHNKEVKEDLIMSKINKLRLEKEYHDYKEIVLKKNKNKSVNYENYSNKYANLYDKKNIQISNLQSNLNNKKENKNELVKKNLSFFDANIHQSNHEDDLALTSKQSKSDMISVVKTKSKKSFSNININEDKKYKFGFYSNTNLQKMVKSNDEFIYKSSLLVIKNYDIIGISSGIGPQSKEYSHQLKYMLIKYLNDHNNYTEDKGIERMNKISNVELIKTILKACSFNKLVNSVEYCEKEILKIGHINSKQSGGIFCSVFIFNNELIILNIGDSRVMGIEEKSNEIKRKFLNIPHNILSFIEKSRIISNKNSYVERNKVNDIEEIYIRNFTNNSVRVSRCIGCLPFYDIGVLRIPDVIEVEISSNMIGIIIGTYIFWKLIDDDIIDFVMKNYKKSKNLNEDCIKAAKELVDYCESKYYKLYNQHIEISCVVVLFDRD